MSRPMPLAEEHLPAIRGVMQLHPEASIYSLSELVAVRLRMPKLGYATLGKFLKLHGIETPKPQRPPARPPRRTGPAEVRRLAVEEGEVPVTPPQLLDFEQTTADEPVSVTRDATAKTRRPPARLTPAHLPLVRRVVTANPGLSLVKLCPLVAEVCGLPHLTDYTLHRYLAAHGIERQVAAHVMHRSERLRARGVLMFPTAMTAVAPVKGEAGVDDAHQALGFAAGSVFALGGLVARQDAQPIAHAVPAGQKPSEALLRIWRDEARREATTWLSAAAVRHAARAALTAALSRSCEEPDPEEFDPFTPRDWWTVETFAGDVADLFRLAIFELAYAHKPDDQVVEHECNTLGRLGGAVELLRALAEKTS